MSVRETVRPACRHDETRPLLNGGFAWVDVLGRRNGEGDAASDDMGAVCTRNRSQSNSEAK